VEEQLDKIFLNDDLSINFKNVTDKLIYHYFSELDTYYCEDSAKNTQKDCSLKENIQNRLSGVLAKYINYEILLISHSMGTIVTFDVLSKLSDEHTINTLITIGSPLGLPIIVGRIFADQKLLKNNITKPFTPNCISNKWYNLSDSLDNIAIDHTLNDDYEANKFGIKAIDITVFNNYEINDKPNPHKSFGYLRTPEIAKIFDEFLKRKRSDILYQKLLSISKSINSSLNIFRKNKLGDSDES
ncbi:MAG: hypothetical protein PF445_04215, partial [Melioribacteraceae bacterium]|nr:hypothetical protein [Melioribacteraceae bacterium]